MSNFQKHLLENMEWTFCKIYLKMHKKCYIKGVVFINSVHPHLRIMLYVDPDK